MPKQATQDVLVLLIHLSLSLVLAFGVAFAVNGYQAVDGKASRHYHGRYLLRVADVTTLVSAGLVIVKFAVASWAVIAFERCGSISIRYQEETKVSSFRLGFMTSWRLPPWVMWPFESPRERIGWTVAVLFILVLPQSIIPPLLSGAIDWISSVAPDQTMLVNSSNPNADPTLWYWYLHQQIDRQAALRRAAGATSHTWADSTEVKINGTDASRNRCRHFVNDDGLPINSTLHGATIPCMKIHDIAWFNSAPSDNITTLI